MERIVIQVEDPAKAALLHQFLKMMDFVKLVKEDEVTGPEAASRHSQKAEDFFAYAGMWSKRDVSLDSIRQKAWPRQGT